MDPLLRALGIYLFLLLVFRILGRRSLSQITTFDFLLLLIVGEAAENGLLGDDTSITNSVVVIAILVGIDTLIAKLKDRYGWMDKLLEGAPLVLVDNGRELPKRMAKAGVDKADVMETARLKHGLERLDQIKYAVRERDGSISIIPAQKD